MLSPTPVYKLSIHFCPDFVSAALLLQRRSHWLDAAKGERRNHYSRALLYPGEVASGVWSNIYVGLAATTPPNG